MSFDAVLAPLDPRRAHWWTDTIIDIPRAMNPDDFKATERRLEDVEKETISITSGAATLTRREYV